MESIIKTTQLLQYLEENVHKTYVDVSDMARVLQERYRADYGRRKIAPFRELVEQGLCFRFVCILFSGSLMKCFVILRFSIQNCSSQLWTG